MIINLVNISSTYQNSNNEILRNFNGEAKSTTKEYKTYYTLKKVSNVNSYLTVIYHKKVYQFK